LCVDFSRVSVSVSVEQEEEEEEEEEEERRKKKENEEIHSEQLQVSVQLCRGFFAFNCKRKPTRNSIVLNIFFNKSCMQIYDIH